MTNTMTRSKSVGAAILLALLLAIWTSPAAAEAGPATTTTTSTRSAGLGDDWRYSTYYLYPLTRHMEESDIPKGWRIPLYPITAVLDTAQLPFGALAGLFGD
jgi:hypothetical protein